MRVSLKQGAFPLAFDTVENYAITAEREPEVLGRSRDENPAPSAVDTKKTDKLTVLQYAQRKDALAMQDRHSPHKCYLGGQFCAGRTDLYFAR